jgi:putative phage-type endonuclease
MQALRLVSTKEMPESEWLDFRRKGIGGSDVAAICGMSKYKSPVAVYLDKIGELPPIEDNPKMKAGRKLEPLIAQWFAEETGKRVMQQHAIFQHKEHDFMLANIDRWVIGENAGLEIKNTSEFLRDEWADEKVPTEYQLQCNHYMAVTGAERWYLCVLLGGWDLQWRVIERNDDLIKNLITIEHSFWHDNVLSKTPPAYSYQDTKLLGDKYPESQPGKHIELGEEHYELIQRVLLRKNTLEAAKNELETDKNIIKAMMGDNEMAWFQGEPIFTWKSNKKGVRSFRFVGGEE